MKRLVNLAIIISIVCLAALTGCTDITKSSNYETYTLKYIVNLTDVDSGEHENTLNDLKNTLNSRLNSFDTAEVKIESTLEDNYNYLTLDFGSIDDIEEIKKSLESNDALMLKKKLNVVYPHPRLVEVSHILIAYEGAEKAGAEVTRTKTYAKELALEVKTKLDNGDNFAGLAKEFSDDKTNKNSDGELETPTGRGTYVDEFENAALALTSEGELSNIVESPFGFHIIKARAIHPEVLEESVDGYKEGLQEKASDTMEKLLAGGNFKLLAQNQVTSDPARIVYSQANWMFREDVKEVFAEHIFDMEPGELFPELIEFQERAFVLAPPIDITSIMKLVDKRDIEKVIDHPKEVKVRHILISYEGAMKASEEITRTKEEAQALAQEIKDKLTNGQDFILLARDYSDDSSNNNGGGVLEKPAGLGNYVEEFENAALGLEVDEISDLVESPFGYHIIQADEITEASEEKFETTQVKFEVLFYAMQPQEWEDTTFNGENLSGVSITYTEEYDPFITLHFNDRGKFELERLTEMEQEEIIGIFLGKELITSFTVHVTNRKGELKILQPNTTLEADELKNHFKIGTLPAPIVLVSDSSIDNTDEIDVEVENN